MNPLATAALLAIAIAQVSMAYMAIQPTPEGVHFKAVQEYCIVRKRQKQAGLSDTSPVSVRSLTGRHEAPSNDFPQRIIWASCHCYPSGFLKGGLRGQKYLHRHSRRHGRHWEISILHQEISRKTRI